MKKILVLGGTQFFGKKAVSKLIEKGHDVTIATRGNKPHPFGDKVEHVLLDARDGSHKGWEKITSQKWDAVFDNVCYTKEDAELLIDKLSDVTSHVYVTSSMAVYEGDKNGYEETDFDPHAYTIDSSKEVDYGEGKRQAEAVLFNHAPFSVTAFRFPIVLDTDDFTERLHYYVKKVLKEDTVYFQNPDARVNFVKGSEAADAIVWFMENEKSGYYNISSTNPISVRLLVQWIEEETGMQPDVVYSGKEEPESPFSTPYDRYVKPDRLIEEGFEVSRLEDWLRPLIQHIIKELRS